MLANNTKLDLRHYEDMARKNHRGLVPMVFAETTLPYALGEIAGFRPAAAKKLHDDGTAVPHESVYRSGSLPEKQVGAGLVDETEDEARRSAVEIPGDVLEAHGLKRMALAKKIAGRDPGTYDEADEIIRAEQQRRSALAERTGGAVTTETAHLGPAA
ncbi:hypothetical protein [Methylobacterium sp. SD21]|uniref:hypothetical protein n=1 Tax=Methylobacterium litchii TaxID=3138810 RepID=UPI00313EC5F9